MSPLDFPKLILEDIILIIKSLNPRKATGPDCIPLKFIKLAPNVINSHLCNIIIKDLGKRKYSEQPKIALARPILKKNLKNNIANYRPVSILNSFSSYAQTILLNFTSVYRESYSWNYSLLRLIGNWKKSLENKNFMGTVLMVLSKAFHYIPHNLLVAKPHAYGLSEHAVTFVYSYLKRRKQGVEINDAESVFQILL